MGTDEAASVTRSQHLRRTKPSDWEQLPPPAWLSLCVGTVMAVLYILLSSGAEGPPVGVQVQEPHPLRGALASLLNHSSGARCQMLVVRRGWWCAWQTVGYSVHALQTCSLEHLMAPTLLKRCCKT